MLISKMWGVEHGGEWSQSPFFFETQCEVRPSPELIRDLDLPKGTRVGIECFDSASALKGLEFEVEGVKCILPKSYYWSRIIGACERNGLEVVYLDNLELWEKSMGMYARARLLRGESELERRTNELLSEADYLFVVGREEGMLARAREKRPDFLIVGAAHGDYFVQSAGKNHLRIRSYEREAIIREVPENLRLNFLLEPDNRGSMPPLESSRAPATPDPTVLIRRESVERRYHSFKHKRVLPAKRPDFIGTWQPDCPELGLFEMYVTGRRFTGRVEDNLGSARFAGSFGEGSIFFIKEYTGAIEGRLEGEIVYEGNVSSEGYTGTFRGKEKEGQFWLMRFQEYLENGLSFG